MSCSRGLGTSSKGAASAEWPLRRAAFVSARGDCAACNGGRLRCIVRRGGYQILRGQYALQEGGLGVDWYYARDGREIGPVDEGQIATLVRDGAIGLSTLVWHEGMGDWQPYGELGPQAAAPPVAGTAACAECGKSFAVDEMTEQGGAYVCDDCRPVHLRRLREAGAPARDFDYGGFWVRFAAKLLDSIIVSFIQAPFLIMQASNSAAYQALVFLMMWVFPFAYSVFFLGKFSATPGKMACGLKVLRPTGERISYLRALGRECAEILSALILLMGYVMAAFDDEKRALHDRICDTRVVHSR